MAKSGNTQAVTQWSTESNDVVIVVRCDGVFSLVHSLPLLDAQRTAEADSRNPAKGQPLLDVEPLSSRNSTLHSEAYHTGCDFKQRCRYALTARVSSYPKTPSRPLPTRPESTFESAPESTPQGLPDTGLTSNHRLCSSCSWRCSPFFHVRLFTSQPR